MQIHYKYTPNVAHISIFQLKVNLLLSYVPLLGCSLLTVCLPWIMDWHRDMVYLYISCAWLAICGYLLGQGGQGGGDKLYAKHIPILCIA